MMTTRETRVAPHIDEISRLKTKVAELEAQLKMAKSGILEDQSLSKEHEAGFRKLRFLEEVSRRLSQSLDPQQTLIELAQLAVPALGDWCAVYFPAKDGTLQPLIAHHNDPQKVALLKRYLQLNPIQQNAERGTGASFTKAEPQLIPLIDDAMLESLITDPERLAMIKGLEIRSGMSLPLIVRGKVIGVIDVVSSDPKRPYGAADLALGMEFAQRVSAALDNARLHEELRKANERFELAERASGGYVYEWDNATNQLIRSSSFTAVLGYGNATSLREEWFDLIHPDDRKRVQAETNAAMQHGGAFSIEYRLRHQAGHYIHIWNQGTVLMSDAGKASRIVGIAVDISTRKQIEEELRESEMQLRQMADAMPQLVWIANGAGEVSYYNQRAAEYAGLKQSESGKWQWQPLLHPDDLEATLKAWQEASAAGAPYVKEHRMQLANGEYRWHLSRAYPFRDDDGHVITWFGTATDIHDLKLAEEANEIANYRFRVAEEAANGFSFDWDLATGNVARSDGLKRVLGYDESELPPGWDGWASIVHPDDLPGDRLQLTTMLNNHAGETIDSEYRARHKNGQYRWMYERAILLRDESGSVCRVIGQTVDITDRKENEARLRESEARFRHLADAMPVLVWISDTTMQCTWFNRHWLQFTGRAFEKEYGQGWIEGLHPNDRDRTLQTYSSAFDKREPFEMEYRLRRHDGEYRWILDRGVPNITPDGNFAGYIGGCIDIHDRWQAEHDAHFLADIGAAINGASEPQALMWQIVNATAQYLETSRAGFNEVDAANDQIVFHSDYSKAAPSIAGAYAISSFGRALAKEMRAGRTTVIQDTQTDPRTTDEYATLYAPAGLRAILSVPMLRNGQWMASLWVAESQPREWKAHEIDILRTVAERAWLAVESARVQVETQALNVTLEARVAERTAALRQSQSLLRQLSAYVERTREDERSRIAREVHDELGGALTVMKMSLAQIKKRIDAGNDVQARLEDLRLQIDALVQNVRRISYDLRPSMLDDFGLLATIEWQAQEWERRTGIQCRLDLPTGLDAALNDKTRTTVFRAFQESLTNIARHAHATEVKVSAQVDKGHLVLVIHDNGDGINPDALQSVTSLGLMGMRERMNEVKGNVEINSEAGQGTTVIIRVPVEPAA